MDSFQKQKVEQYTGWLVGQIVELSEKAEKDAEAVNIYSQNGVVRFQVNRRHNEEKKVTAQTGLNGPNDFAVPVLKITNQKGKIRAVAFGYACHPTVLNLYQWSGDYAGFAQIALEKKYRGVTALFFQGAGADMNPMPRRSVSLTQQFGQELTTAVDRVLNEEMKELKPELATAYSEINLKMGPLPTKEELEKIKNVQETDKNYFDYKKNWAENMLRRLDRGEILPASYPYPVQALPPIATMRVNNVVGCDRQQWNETPFHWVETVNKYGFKPWLGLFIYNITPEGIEELKKLTYNGLATVSPQALGRPQRTELSKKEYFIPDYYYPNSIHYLSDHYDEFIFFDHNNRKPWTDETADKTLKAVDDWHREVGPLQMSNYLVPHWGEIGSNTIAHIHDKWNIEFILSGILDKSYFDEYYLTKSLKRGPFYLYDEQVVGRHKGDASDSRSFYTADFVELAGRNFFGFVSPIYNKLTEYELQPDNNVDSTAKRGTKILSRGLEAKALAVLFTHETDYIFRVKPENWDKIFSKISNGISKYNPIYLTHDEALKVVRAFHTSEIQNSEYNASTGELTIKMTRVTDVPTSVFVYSDNDGVVIEELVEIPAFENEVSRDFKLSK